MNTGNYDVCSITGWSLLIAWAFFVSPAHAQNSVDNVADRELIEEIIVTGSRIPRAGFDTLMPAIVVDAEFIQDRGFTDIASALNEIPAFGVPQDSTYGGQSSTSVGQNFVNFFGLGQQRTLTLVNGRRFVSSNSPGHAPGLMVDLNVIPASLVDRVETIAIGGAPIYGADAIAGTVNVIMKRNFEGFDVKTSYGVSSEGDMTETEFAVSWGANTADGRGNVVLGVEYTDREGLIFNDRAHHRAGWQFLTPIDPDSPFAQELHSDVHANIVSNNGVITPGALLLPNLGIGQFDGSFLQFSPDGSLRTFDTGTPTGNVASAIGGDGLFLQDVLALFTPLERILANAFAHYEIANGVEVFGELWIAHTEATELANQPAYQSGFFGDESASIEFPIDHPLLTPAAMATLAGLTNGGVPISTFHIQRSSVDLRPGNNPNDAETNLLRMVGGLQGDFDAGNRFWNWDLSYNVGQSTSDSRSTDIVSERFFYALDVVRDPVTGEPGCRVVVDPSSRPPPASAPFGTTLQSARYDDCVPLDIFGEGRASQAALDYISVNAVSKSVLEQSVVSANIGTDLVDLPAGSLDVVLGFEHREESGDYQSGGFRELGLGRSVPINSVVGNYETDELYGEFYAPLVSNDMGIPLISSASIEGAWRTVDNSLAGRDDIWTIGGRYAPIPDVEFRGNVTRSVRAPGISELFFPLSQALAIAQDPCDRRWVDQGPNPAVRRSNCISGGGNLPPIPDPDNFTSLISEASRGGVAAGNINLKNEVADSWTVGVIFRPRFIERLSVAIDYVDIDIADAIEFFGVEPLMAACYDQVDFPNDFCDRFNRDPDGQINGFEASFVNVGRRTFKGIVTEVVYATDLANGQLDVTASIFNLREDISRIQESVQDETGIVGKAEWQASILLRYSHNQWSAMLQPRFIGGGPWSNDNAPMALDVMGEDDVWIVNGAFTYDFGDAVSLQLNINNLFDDVPSPGASATQNDDVYDNLGRYYRLGLRVQF